MPKTIKMSNTIRKLDCLHLKLFIGASNMYCQHENKKHKKILLKKKSSFYYYVGTKNLVCYTSGNCFAKASGLQTSTFRFGSI